MSRAVGTLRVKEGAAPGRPQPHSTHVPTTMPIQRPRPSRPRLLARALLAAAVLLAVAPPAASAQSAQRHSLQLSGIFVGTYGTAYEGLKDGGGLELQYRLTPGLWSVGVGLQSSVHTFSDASLSGMDVSLAGLFIEPRRILDVGSAQFAPYLSARLSFLQQSLDVPTTAGTVTATASGTQLNGGGGVLLRLSPRVNLDLGATYGLINFGDVALSGGGGRSTVSGTSGNGSNLVLRAGVAIGLK